MTPFSPCQEQPRPTQPCMGTYYACTQPNWHLSTMHLLYTSESFF